MPPPYPPGFQPPYNSGSETVIPRPLQQAKTGRQSAVPQGPKGLQPNGSLMTTAGHDLLYLYLWTSPTPSSLSAQNPCPGGPTSPLTRTASPIVKPLPLPPPPPPLLPSEFSGIVTAASVAATRRSNAAKRPLISAHTL